jgi:hypothetical protein
VVVVELALNQHRAGVLELLGLVVPVDPRLAVILQILQVALAEHLA